MGTKGSSGNKFHLVIAEEDLAAWAATNNCFPHTLGQAPGNLWNGVMFYLGAKRHRTTGQPKHLLQEVSFEFENGGEKTYTEQQIREERYWINIIAAKSGPDSPMTIENWQKAYPDPPRASDWFEPYKGGLITFWQKQAPGIGYSMTAERAPQGGTHNRYLFTCDKGDGFVVQVYKGDELLEKFPDPNADNPEVSKITLKAKGGPGPKDSINPVERP